MERHIVIDFDSTFTQVEALDVLGEISLARDKEKEKNLEFLFFLFLYTKKNSLILQIRKMRDYYLQILKP